MNEIDYYRIQIKNLEEQVEILKDIIKNQEKMLKKYEDYVKGVCAR